MCKCIRKYVHISFLYFSNLNRSSTVNIVVKKILRFCGCIIDTEQNIYIYMYIYKILYVFIFTHIHVNVYVHRYIYIHIYVCI